MPTNRFFNPGSSKHQSQYVPLKMPFQLMQQNLARKDAEMDKLLNAYDATDDGLGIAGLDRTQSPNYFGTIGGSSFQGGSELLLGDRTKSEQSRKAIQDGVASLGSDERILKASSGELADDIIKMQQMVINHKAQNELLNKREKATTGILKTIADNKDQWEKDPSLLFDLETELARVGQDPNHIPTDVGVGKYFDSSGYMLGKVNMLKDTSHKSLGDDKNFLTWSKRSGVSADKYANFVYSLMQDDNSPLKQEADRKVSAMLRNGKITEAQVGDVYNKIIEQHVATAKNLEHMSSDKGRSEKSQRLVDQESASAFDTAGQGLETLEINPDATSFNEIESTLAYLDSEENRLTKVIANPNVDDATKNVAMQKLEDLSLKKTSWEYNKQLAEANINIGSGWASGNKALLPEETEQLAYEDPELYSMLFTKAEGTNQYVYNQQGETAFMDAAAEKYAAKMGVTKAQAHQVISTDPKVNALLTEAQTTSSENVEDRLRIGTEYTAYKMAENNLTNLNEISDFLTSVGVEHDPTDARDVGDKFGRIEAESRKIDNQKYITQKKRSDLESKKETYKSIPIDGVANVDYTVPTVISLGTLPQEMIRSTFFNVGLEGTEVSVDGKIMNNGKLKQLIMDKIIKEGGTQQSGGITGAGGVVLKGAAVVPVISEEEMQLMFAEETGDKWNEKRDVYNEWAKDFNSVLDNPSAVTIKMVPSVGQSANNNIRYAQKEYLSSNEDSFTKAKNLSGTNSTTYSAINKAGGITQLNQQGVMDSSGEALEIPLNKTLKLTGVDENNNSFNFEVDIHTSKVIDNGDDKTAPTFLYTYYDELTGKNETLKVTGSDGNNFIEEYFQNKYFSK